MLSDLDKYMHMHMCVGIPKHFLLNYALSWDSGIIVFQRIICYVLPVLINAVVTCEIKLFWKKFEITSVFYLLVTTSETDITLFQPLEKF